MRHKLEKEYKGGYFPTGEITTDLHVQESEAQDKKNKTKQRNVAGKQRKRIEWCDVFE